jgi:DNA polymerase-1
MTIDKSILVIDGSNMFIRCYSACPDMSSHGHQVGGTIGSLRTLRRLLNELQPSALYLVWEGGGSSRRKSLFSEYKENRRPEKLNRFYEDDIPDSDDNRQHQLVTLINLVRFLPIRQLYVPDCEGDDVIAFLCRGPLRGLNKVIASSDKDMYQLLDPLTRTYSFHKKRYVTTQDVLEEFRISCVNFSLAKSLCGDPSDNIPGVEGLGFRTVAKKFPFLGSDNPIILQDIFDYCHSHAKESIIYRRVLEHCDEVERNWRLIHLDVTSLSPEQIKRIETQLSTSTPKGDRMSLIRGLVQEGIGDFDVESMFYAFNCLER